MEPLCSPSAYIAGACFVLIAVIVLSALARYLDDRKKG